MYSKANLEDFIMLSRLESGKVKGKLVIKIERTAAPTFTKLNAESAQASESVYSYNAAMQ